MFNVLKNYFMFSRFLWYSSSVGYSLSFSDIARTLHRHGQPHPVFALQFNVKGCQFV